MHDDLEHQSILPGVVQDFCALAPGPDGNVVVAYAAEDDGEAGHPCRLALVGRDGRLLWLQDGIEFVFGADGHTELFHSPGSGPLFVLSDTDDDGGAERFIRLIDPASGEPIGTIAEERREFDGTWLPASALRGPFLHGAEVLPDVDGTVVLVQSGPTEYNPVLTRHEPDGRALPLWPEDGPPPKKKGFLASLFSGGMEETRALPEAWESMPDRVRQPPRDARVTIGADGHLVLLHRQARHLARYDRAGRIVESRPLEPLPLDSVRQVAAAPDGTVYVLFEHAEKIGGDGWSHVARIRPGRQPEVWLGPHVEQSPSFLSYGDDKLRVAPDGTLIVGDDAESLRIIAPDGRTLWRSPATVREDPERLAELETRRRKRKKSVPDRKPGA